MDHVRKSSVHILLLPTMVMSPALAKTLELHVTSVVKRDLVWRVVARLNVMTKEIGSSLLLNQ